MKQGCFVLLPCLLQQTVQAVICWNRLPVFGQYWPVCSVSADLLRMFFDALYDEDVIKEEAFYKWETSKDPAEQTGKGVALKSVTAFFTWLREAEEESDKD